MAIQNPQKIAEGRRVGMSLREFQRRFDNEGPFEVYDGEVVKLSPQATRSARCRSRVWLKLTDFLQDHPLGEAFAETAFVLPTSRRRNWVKNSRVLDVCYVSAARLAALDAANPDWDRGPLPLVPERVVEVVSPTDEYSMVEAKVEHYLHDGMQLVWVIDPQARTVVIHTQDRTERTRLPGEATLTCETLLPGFALPLGELFK